MRHLPKFAGVLALALAVALVGCGQTDHATEASAALTVSSAPQSEVFVDGVRIGQSGQTLALAPGEKTIEFRTDGFKTFTTKVTLVANETKTIDASLDSIDPSSPAVVAKLMAAEGVEMAPWVAPEATRGRSGKQAVAVLLWPSKDIRKNGLVNFAVEADETYGGDASLEFRSGRKVIYREKFNPESVTTVRPIPAEVLEQVKVNSKIKWGLYFEDSRHPITATFKVVRRTKVERQLERVRKSRHMQRQPVITRQIAEAVILENNRLYSEALVANLAIATEHAGSTQPLRGIVTTLRRLDAENSELFAAVAPNVSGKGQRGVTARRGGLGITAWSPLQRGSLPTPSASEGAGPSDTRTEPGVTPTTPSTDEGLKAGTPEQGTSRLQTQLDEMRAEQGVVQAEATAAQNEAHAAKAASERAETDAQQAQADAAAARAAYENAAQPTQAQQAAMMKAGRAAEETAEAARAAQEAAQAAEDKARGLEGQVDRLNQGISHLQSALDMANSVSPKTGAEPSLKAPSETELRGAADAAQTAADNAKAEWKKAQSAVEDAQREHATNPNATTQANLENAEAAADAAKAEAGRAQTALAKAQEALEGFSGQMEKPRPNK